MSLQDPPFLTILRVAPTKKSSMSEELPAVGFLENLEDEVRTQLVSQGTLYTLTSGQHIIEEGAEQDHLFLILVNSCQTLLIEIHVRNGSLERDANFVRCPH